MSITSITRGITAPPGDSRSTTAGDFLDAGLWLDANPAARRPPSPAVNIRAAGANRAEKITDLHAIAASWGTGVAELPDGTLYAEVVFGSLTFEAHVSPAGPTVTGYQERMKRAAAVAA